MTHRVGPMRPEELPRGLIDVLGFKMTTLTTEKTAAEITVREEITNGFGVLHGGVVMAMADQLGGVAAMLNIPEGTSTATIESKTNFFLGIRIGDTAYAECTPLHRGRTTMVWQTRITRGDGKLAAVVTQTQIVIEARNERTPAGAQ